MAITFIPPESTSSTYAKELFERVQNLKKLDSTSDWSKTKLEDAAYRELRNSHRELFENPQQWLIAIMKKYRHSEEQETPKKEIDKEIAPEKRRPFMPGYHPEVRLNRHDRDDDEPTEFEIKEATKISPAQNIITEDDKPEKVENEKTSPIQEGRVHVACTTKADRFKKLEEEAKAIIAERKMPR
ncbi:MAG: hypothetical protein PHW24_04755 [Candidatus Moranbacteria bacterium]|nr:hypothetical protein [Candidatus Moranbacteria bacterium]